MQLAKFLKCVKCLCFIIFLEISIQKYSFLGSDDFNIYAWKIPIHSDTNQPTKTIKRADFVLKGHRSIVNQVRFNPVFNCVASSGVEKKIKLWSPFNITNEDLDKHGPSFSRYVGIF